MKYKNEISINLPRKEVISKFRNTDNYSHWQEGLKTLEHLTGKEDEVGSTSRMVYAGRKSDLVIEARVVKNSYPEEFVVEYRSKGVFNKVINKFSEVGSEQCRWETINYFRFRGMMALMAPFMKTAFTSNTLLNMERFKQFAEKDKNRQQNTAN